MKKCKQGYYYCYTDEVCKPIPKGLRVTARFSGGGKEPEETGIDVPTNGNGDGNGGNGGDGGGGMSEGSLRKWFKGSKSKDEKPGWVNVLTGGTCASDEPGEGVPKCVSRSKYDSMTKAERKSAARRKKTADSGQQEKSGGAKPTYVSTDKPKKKMKKEEVEIIEGKDKKGKGSGTKDACYHKVKSRYSVWPSAYASGALVKCRKKGAANWGNKSESVEYSDWRDDFKATEYEFIDIIKAEPLVSEGAMPDAIDPTAHNKARKQKKIRYMTQSPNKNEAEVARRMSKGPSLPMEEFETVDEGQKCWKGYEKKGTKKMFGKVVNNCVKKEEFVDEAKHTATKSDLESKVGGGNLKKLVVKAVKRIDYDVDGDVDPNDKVEKKTGNYGEELPTPFGKFKTKIKKEEFSDWRDELGEGAAWTKKSGKNKEGGLNEKGRKSYEKENPGSDLKAPSKKVGNKRRASFCARMKGMRKRQKPSNNTGDDRLSKSLRAWNC